MLRPMPTNLSVEELARSLSAGESVFLLDVRQPWEHETAALPDSTLLPLPEIANRGHELSVPAGARLVAYCHHGVRSFQAALILESQGLGPVASLDGGIDAWSLRIDPSVPRY
jgi:adenylyltransferase/sulfurtransferase